MLQPHGTNLERTSSRSINYAHAIQLAVVEVMYKCNEYEDYNIKSETPQDQEDEDDMTLAEIATRMLNEEINDEENDVEEA